MNLSLYEITLISVTIFTIVRTSSKITKSNIDNSRKRKSMASFFSLTLTQRMNSFEVIGKQKFVFR